MLLGMGSAQTDEALFAECARYLQQAGHIVIPKNQQRILTSATTLRRQIGKPILEWTEEDILTAYQGDLALIQIDAIPAPWCGTAPDL